MPKAVNTVWHFNQESLVVRWVNGRVEAVESDNLAGQERRPRASASAASPRPLSTRHLSAIASARSEQRVAA
ncbi:hypothetical protein RAS12_30155 (plasmid) [Achromobacter seleniivolatilans]|uniref:DUF2442 domain-containing protein n=1 Tax=Achromobacter seleniivolatilans TaxID=3047478 RepID=A0ABY9MDQ1_9BURK|nr:hypothetical protein [Achromobacter sp. R39]WMD23897.1 hypothetical protein RAS12_30155 [Achromobacter sp. R39]